MHFSWTAAAPFFWAALNQIVVALFVFLGTRAAKNDFDNRGMEKLRELHFTLPGGGDAGTLKEGLYVRQLLTESMAPDEIMGTQSRYRDATTILAGGPVLILPMALSHHVSHGVTLWGSIAVAVVTIGAAWLVFKKKNFYDRAKIWVFGAATVVLVLVNGTFGAVVGFTAVPAAPISHSTSN